MSNPSNTVHLIGRLTADPELHHSPTGKPICELRLAVEGLAGETTTGYIAVSCWHAPGEACARILTKGWLIAASGELRVAPWQSTHRRGVDIGIPYATVKFLSAPHTRPEPEPESESGPAPADQAEF